MPTTPEPEDPHLNIAPSRSPIADPQSPARRRGAPKGNLNALKHGQNSKQFSQVGMLLASNPKVREALLNMGRKHGLKQQRADEIAALLFVKLMQRARQVAGRDFVSFPEGLEPTSIALEALEQRRARTRRDPKPRQKIARNPQNNSNPASNPEQQPGSR